MASVSLATWQSFTGRLSIPQPTTNVSRTAASNLHFAIASSTQVAQGCSLSSPIEVDEARVEWGGSLGRKQVARNLGIGKARDFLLGHF